ncbi:DUF1610 domain-containing protein [Candidatus Woesearchaeota archaeon]|nr:DUF1610 domain-containing protein [Candidatus Woesearchaeota archaeon]
MKEIKCTSCNTKLSNQTGSVVFKCPECGKSEIARCYHCREIAARYTCSNCSFSGPN